MTRRSVIGDIRREELTLAAMKCLAAKGYDRVTLDDVTKEAGLSKGIASYYFRNREDLLISVIQRMWDNMVAMTRKVWDIPEEEGEEGKKVYSRVKDHFSDPEIDLVAIIKDGIRFVINWIHENQHVVRVIMEFWCQVPRNALITELNHSMHDYLVSISTAVIHEGGKRGIFKKVNPRMAAYVLISSMTGIAFNYTINRKGIDHKKLEKEFNRLVFDYLMA